MKLYYSPGACSLSPHIVAREAGLPLTTVRVDTKNKTTESGDDYRVINPKGYVPLLELDDGVRLTEGPAIVQYLADLAPAAKLAPPNGTLERYQLQEWLNFITSEIHKQFSPLFDGTMPEEAKEKFRNKLAGRFDLIAAQLEGRDYLMGSFTVADAYLFTVLGWARYTGPDLARWPILQAYVARIAARPHVQEALRAEGLLK
ncbi:MAG: glutathione transferase GstA [Burkholderiaceae bacterium]